MSSPLTSLSLSRSISTLTVTVRSTRPAAAMQTSFNVLPNRSSSSDLTSLIVSPTL